MSSSASSRRSHSTYTLWDDNLAILHFTGSFWCMKNYVVEACLEVTFLAQTILLQSLYSIPHKANGSPFKLCTSDPLATARWIYW